MANFAIQNGAGQEQAIIASEGAANGSPILSRELDKINFDSKVNKANLMENIIESGGTKEVTGQIVKDMLTKMANAGMMFEGVKMAPKAEGRTERKAENKDRSVSDGFADQVSLSINDEKGLNLPVQAASQSKGKFSQAAAKKWEEMRAQLVEEGRSSEEISQTELQFKTSEVQKNVLNVLKESAILYYLDSDTKLNKIMRRRGFAELVNQAGKELGKEAAQAARSEVKGFVLQELENQLIVRTFLQDGKFEDSQKLVKVGENVGLDTDKWIDQVWPQKKEDHGLYLLDISHAAAGYVDLKDTDSHARKDRGCYDYTTEDEKDLMLNRLRAAYLQMILKPGTVAKVSSWFKMHKLKNGMIKLGIYTKDVDEKIQEEAKTLAKVKTMEMLDEALHERASFFAEGTAKDMVENKVKNLLKNLDRLGFELKPEEFVALRDKANREMYGLVLKEIEATQNGNVPKGKQKMEMLKQLKSRLQAETPLGLREEA